MDQLENAIGSPVDIVFDNVSIAYGETQVIKNVSIDIHPGEFFGFLGPSGSGKSTLLRAIAGFGPHPTGRILIGGDDVTDLPPWRRDVAMVFQSYALWPHMTVRKNVAFGLEERRLPRREIQRRVDEALALVALSEFAERRPSQLSGGQQQRVALARTIVVRPRVLLLDEPLSNLDAALRVEMRRELHELQRRLSLTTVFVTHDQEEANTICDRIAILADGVVQQVGPPMELYDRPANRFVAQFLGTANLVEGAVQRVDGAAIFRSADGVTVPLPSTLAFPAGGGAILVRPQSIEIRRVDDLAQDGRVRLDGVVELREFLGSHVRYGVRVGTTSLRVDASHRPGRPDYECGDRVSLYVATNELRLLAD
jgi:iron(III) transport system ATP-binding protein